METNTALREKVQQLRKAGLSLRATAEACGISKVRVHQLEHPHNPKGTAKRYKCRRCGLAWSSTSRTKPDRCPPRKKGCGSYYWDRDDAGTTRTPGPKPTAGKKRRDTSEPG